MAWGDVRDAGLMTDDDLHQKLKAGGVTMAELREWQAARENRKPTTPNPFEIAAMRAAIRALVEAVGRATPGLDVEEAMRAVQRREAQGSTDLGHEVAIPHARLPGLPRTLVAIARLAEPLRWRPHGDPVQLVFLVLSPLETPIEQSRALMRVARLVRDEVMAARLAEAPSPEALVEVIRASDLDC